MARDDQVLGALRRIIRATDRYSRHLNQSDGVTAPQLLILQTLESRKELTMGEIAREVSLGPGTVTSILDRLQKRGLIERRRGARDKRRVYARLTDAGRSMIHHTPLPLQEAFRERFARLREGEQTAILKSLEQVAAMMNADEAEPEVSNRAASPRTPGNEFPP